MSKISPFEVGGGVLDPPSPYIEVTITFRGVSSTIRALYDTGTDVTQLGASWKTVFGVNDSLLPKLPVRSASGKEAMGSLAFVDAELDGEPFKLPVLFHPEAQVDLFGRGGIGERFKVDVDPSAAETRVTRIDVDAVGADEAFTRLTAEPGNFGEGWHVAPPPA